MPQPQQDPFEAYRQKRQEEREQKKAEEAKANLPPREDGRPRGFESHRLDFDKGEAPAPAPAAPPKGFDSGRTKKMAPPQPDARPKGMSSHKLGPGPKQPIERDLHLVQGGLHGPSLGGLAAKRE